MKRPDNSDLHGVLLVDKPVGWTSHDVVNKVRNLTGIRRVGHGGTLDPFATGVLVIAVGKATRFLQYAQSSDKRYVAHVVLGVETDTGDIDGVIVRRTSHQPWPDQLQLRSVLQSFVGRIEQRPPAYSAIRVDGRRLYELAREGKVVDAPTRTVDIDAIDLIRYDPPDAIIDICCGHGTYIRSLARDIGAAFGVGAYCHGLVRTRSGNFSLSQSWTIADLEQTDLRVEWSSVSYVPDALIADLPAAILSEPDVPAWYHGRSVKLHVISDLRGEVIRAYGESGEFIGLGRFDGDASLKPFLVYTPRD